MNEFIVVILSSFKFAMTFPVAIFEFGFGFFKTLLFTNLGGLAGIFFFIFLAQIIIRLWKKYVQPFFNNSYHSTNKQSKRLFTPSNRRIAYFKMKYGLAGVAAITPLLLSIPVGTFIAVRYFKSKRAMIIWLLSANFFWSLVYSGSTFYVMMFINTSSENNLYTFDL